MPKLSFSTNAQPNPLQPLRLAIIQEHLRQARLTFNLSVITIALSLSVSAVGAILILSGKASEGTTATTSGLLSTGLCTQVAKDASNRLERLVEALKATQSES